MIEFTDDDVNPALGDIPTLESLALEPANKR
jgi:hypothetical protein